MDIKMKEIFLEKIPMIVMQLLVFKIQGGSFSAFKIVKLSLTVLSMLISIRSYYKFYSRKRNDYDFQVYGP